MNQHTIAHRWHTQWTNRSGQRYSKCNSMIYDRDTIYSWGYHWPIARRVTLSDSGRTVTLLHARSHTPSTNKHTGLVRRTAGHSNCEYVSHDHFRTVTDEATLARAKHLTLEEDKDTAYEARVARNARARADRQHNGEVARRDLEMLFDVDCEDLSLSAAIKLRNLMLGIPGNNFQANRTWKHSGQRRGGLADRHPELVKIVADLLPQNYKTPGILFTVITNFQLLAA